MMNRIASQAGGTLAGLVLLLALGWGISRATDPVQGTVDAQGLRIFPGGDADCTPTVTATGDLIVYDSTCTAVATLVSDATGVKLEFLTDDATPSRAYLQYLRSDGGLILYDGYAASGAAGYFSLKIGGAIVPLTCNSAGCTITGLTITGTFGGVAGSFSGLVEANGGLSVQSSFYPGVDGVVDIGDLTTPRRYRSMKLAGYMKSAGNATVGPGTATDSCFCFDDEGTDVAGCDHSICWDDSAGAVVPSDPVVTTGTCAGWGSSEFVGVTAAGTWYGDLFSDTVATVGTTSSSLAPIPMTFSAGLVFPLNDIASGKSWTITLHDNNGATSFACTLTGPITGGATGCALPGPVTVPVGALQWQITSSGTPLTNTFLVSWCTNAAAIS